VANERELKLKITGDSSAAEKAVKRLETALAKAQAELEKAAADAAKSDEKVEDLGDAATKAGREVDDLGDQAADTGRKVKGLGDDIEPTTKELDGLGWKAGDLAKDQLGPLGDVADKAGIDIEKLQPSVLAAGAGFALLGQQLAAGIEKWGQYTHEVRQYSDAANIGTEEASRFASVFKQFGVEADDGIDALKTLAEEAGDAPEKFAKYGIEITRAKDGSVDLSKTLQAVAERFRQTQDPTQRAAMGAALFGDNWLRIAPILERGSDGIADLLANVDESAIVTSKAMRQQREFEQATRELKTTWDELSMAMARDAIPRLTQMAKDLSTVTEATQGFTGGVFGLSDAMNLFNPIAMGYDERLKRADEAARDAAWSAEDMGSKVAQAALKAGDAANKAADLAAAEQAAAAEAAELQRRQDDMARSSRDAMSAIDAQRDSLQELTSVIFSMAGTDLAVEQANVALGESMDRLVEKQTAVTDAVNQYGQDSPQATTAVRDYEKGLLDTRGAADRLAQAQVEQARQQATAAGQTLTDAEAIAIYKGSIENTRDATNDPALWSGLDTMASKIGANADAAAAARDRINEATEAAANLAAQAFGERAASIARGIIARSPSAGFSQQRSDGAQTASVTNNVTVQAQTNANPWDIAAQVDWALRTGGR